ncbi:MAG: threonine/serine exporter family protein [Clostridia bacterium]
MSAPWRMKALCLAGRIILENGGETYRAEDTVIHMAQSLGLCEVDVFGVPSGLFISFTDEEGERITSVTRIFPRSIHLSRVDAVNQLSRQLSAKVLDPQALLPALKEAETLDGALRAGYGPGAAAVAALGFAVMFGGGWVDMLVGAACAALTQMVPYWLRHKNAGAMSCALLGSLFCTLIPQLFHALTGLGVTEAMVASAIMPLLPGLSMTNAVQDILRGDMLSGVAHGARAVMLAALVAGGALIGTHLYGMLEVWLSLPIQSTMPAQGATTALWLRAGVIAVSSFVAGVGLGALFYAPRKAMLWGAALGAVGYLCYWLALEWGASEAVAMFMSAFLAAMGAQCAAKRLHMIATIFVTIAILPLVPGLGLYRAMSAIAMGQMGTGLATAAQTMALILMIALGVGLGSALLGAGKRLER